jgi:hypothetical protein
VVADSPEGSNQATYRFAFKSGKIAEKKYFFFDYCILGPGEKCMPTNVINQRDISISLDNNGSMASMRLFELYALVFF